MGCLFCFSRIAVLVLVLGFCCAGEAASLRWAGDAIYYEHHGVSSPLRLADDGTVYFTIGSQFFEPPLALVAQIYLKRREQKARGEILSVRREAFLNHSRYSEIFQPQAEDAVPQLVSESGRWYEVHQGRKRLILRSPLGRLYVEDETVEEGRSVTFARGLYPSVLIPLMKIYQVPQETRALLDVEENQADLKWAGTEAPTPPPPAELVSSSNHDTHSASATRRREEFFPDWAPRYSQARRNYRQVVKKFPDPELHSYSSSGLPERYTELRHALAKAQVEMSRKAAAGTSIEVIDRQARTNQTLSDNLQKFWAHWIEEKGGLQSLTPEARAQYQADLTLFDSLSVEGRFMRFWGQAMQAKPAPIPQEGRAFQGWFPRKPGLTPMEEQGVEAAALADLLAAASGDAIYLASVKRRLSELAPKYPKLRLLGF